MFSTAHYDKILVAVVIQLKGTQFERENKNRKEIDEMCAARDKKPGFDSEFTGNGLRIKLRGEIDHHSAVAVRSAIDDMIRSKRPSELLIDMSAVDFMDSSGLGLIMGRYNTMKEIGGILTVLDPTPATKKIMNLAGLERIIRIKHTSKSNKSDIKGTEARRAAAAVVDANCANKTEQRKNTRGDEK